MQNEQGTRESKRETNQKREIKNKIEK